RTSRSQHVACPAEKAGIVILYLQDILTHTAAVRKASWFSPPAKMEDGRLSNSPDPSDAPHYPVGYAFLPPHTRRLPQPKP
ncbi:hypothetical protein LEMLEM_LOCUS3595, partial [Lemmus lemmus]